MLERLADLYLGLGKQRVIRLFLDTRVGEPRHMHAIKSPAVRCGDTAELLRRLCIGGEKAGFTRSDSLKQELQRNRRLPAARRSKHQKQRALWKPPSQDVVQPWDARRKARDMDH
ncbi:hypothetical protein LMG27198_38940 [Methylocystis echinoides]|uniref:Uncharacterized protein n=1 Tax=Methylocystis echinoides TaxID=29468 RepID=A0A9W6GXD3_9HYPH|nr:hypothetical protein LMG27198_38940 [Methylocystis echinoides]